MLYCFTLIGGSKFTNELPINPFLELPITFLVQFTPFNECDISNKQGVNEGSKNIQFRMNNTQHLFGIICILSYQYLNVNYFLNIY